jgi:hypothetical protein
MITHAADGPQPKMNVSAARPSVRRCPRVLDWVPTYENNRLRATRRPCANNSPSFIHFFSWLLFLFPFSFSSPFRRGSCNTKQGTQIGGRYTKRGGGGRVLGTTSRGEQTSVVTPQGKRSDVCVRREIVLDAVHLASGIWHLASGIWQVSITQHCCFFDGPKPPTQRPMLFCLFWTRSVQSIRQSPTIDGVLV